MKRYIESGLDYFNGKASDVVQHMFCVLGNSVELNNKGFLKGNLGCDEVFDFPEPEAFNDVYPWDDSKNFQPFRNLAGCRDIGFKETVEYFLKCLEVTPDTVGDCKKWKDNIEIIKDILLNTPTITDEYPDIESGFEVFKNKVKDYLESVDSSEEVKSVSKVWLFNVDSSTCPSFVIDEVLDIVRTWGFIYNDKFVFTSNLFKHRPNIYYWLKLNGVSDGETVIMKC
jgi:hypothetical protein